MRFLIPILILLFSCKEDIAPEVISLDELTGETGSEKTNDSLQPILVDTKSSLFNDFVNSQSSLYDTITIHKPHSIDRFGFSTKQKLEFKGKTQIKFGNSSITPSASFYYYTFSDTIKTKNAFYNWLDCFGKECNVLKLNENRDDIKAHPSFTLVYDTCIVAVEYLCENEKNNWKSFQDSIIATFGKSYQYRIDVGCDGPVKWK